MFKQVSFFQIIIICLCFNNSTFAQKAEFSNTFDSCACTNSQNCCPNNVLYNAVIIEYNKGNKSFACDKALDLSDFYFSENKNDTGTYLLDYVRNRIKQINTEVVAKLYSKIGYFWFLNNYPDSALLFYEKAFDKFLDGGDSSNAAQQLIYQSEVLPILNRRIDEIEVLKKAFNIGNIIANTNIIVQSRYNLGMLYLETKQYNKARTEFIDLQKLLEADPVQNPIYISTALGNLMTQLGKHDSALFFHNKSFNYIPKNGNGYFKMSTLANVGITLCDLNRYSEAEPLLDSALEFAENLKIWYYKGRILAYKSLCKSQLDPKSNAISPALNAYEFNVQSNYLEGQKIALEIICAQLEQQNSFEKLSHYQKQLLSVKDSIQANEQRNQLLALSVKHSVELRKRENQKLEAENQIIMLEKEQAQSKSNFLLLSIAALLALLLFSAFYYFKTKKSNLLLKAQKVKIESQKEQLVALDQSKSNFFINIAHELKTPLTLVKAPLEFVLNQNDERISNLIKSNIIHAIKSTNKIAGLINEIMDLSKIQHTKLQLNLAPTNIYNEATRLFDSFESLAESKQISYNFYNEIVPETWLNIDFTRYEHIFNNLVSNSLKFTPIEGTVSVKLSYNNNDLLLEVTDNGIGISVDEQDHIFKRFYRANNANKTSGTGIGLSYSYEIAKLMGGQLIAKTSENGGTQMHMSINAKKCEAPISQETLEPDFDLSFEQSLSYDSNKVVLIVEDNQGIRDYLSHLIGKYYKAITAPNGSYALEILEKNKVDLITADVMMPEIDGIELLEKVKQKADLNLIPFILLTARNDEELKLEAIRIGVDDFIQKPFSANELLARINALINNFNERKQAIATVDTPNNDITQRVKELILENIDNSNFKVPQLAAALSMSERNLYRIIKSESGLTPTKFINEIKLTIARKHLQVNRYKTVQEVAFAVGFETNSYFSKLFKERFGKSPAEYLKP